MIELACIANFVLAYFAYYLYDKKLNHSKLGLLVFSFGFANFLCGLLILGMLIRGLR